MANIIGKTFWSPQIFSTEDFISSLFPGKIIDKADLILELFKIHRSISKKNEDFDDFLNDAEIILKDFDDIDRNLVDAKLVFRFLSESKAIKLWNVDGSPLTDFQKNYLLFYQSLEKYYKEFNTLLDESKQAYSGKAYRYVSDNIEYLSKNIVSEHIIFAGFNALSISEEKIIKYFVENQKAIIFWNTDEYYINNEIQEAGFFIRKYFKTWSKNSQNWIEKDYLKHPKNIEIIGVSQNIAQAKYCSQLLNKIITPENQEKTAVVLPDEKLLLPLLSHLPENISDVNITMGIPLKQTAVFSLFSAYAELHLNAKVSKKETFFNLIDVNNFLFHPIFIQLFGFHKEKINLLTVRKSIFSIQKSFITKKEIEQLILKNTYNDEKNIVSFFNYQSNPENLLSSFIGLIEYLKNRSDEISDNENILLLKEYLFHLSLQVSKLNDYVKKYNFINSIKSLKNIWAKIVSNINIPFYGEPLKGLQIMGMLETRLLDFENIVLLSANENILPTTSLNSSLIPFSIKKHFGLPTFRDNQSIFAYHFYRLLQKSKNVYLIYNTDTNSFGSGDKSRFLQQLSFELKKHNPQINIEEKKLHIPIIYKKNDRKICIEKDEQTNILLDKLAKNGLSPSSISTYITCPLKFYFSKIAYLKEPYLPNAGKEAQLLGNIVHNSLEYLYKKLIDKRLVEKDYEIMFMSLPFSLKIAVQNNETVTAKGKLC